MRQVDRIAAGAHSGGGAPRLLRLRTKGRSKERKMYRAVVTALVDGIAAFTVLVSVLVPFAYGGKDDQSTIDIAAASPQKDSSDSHGAKNLALPESGGVIVRFTSAGGAVGRLVDGSGEGWQSSKPVPQDLVFAFRGDQVALIDRIVLDTTPGSARRADPSTRPKKVSIAVSLANPFDGFEELAQFTLSQEPREHSFPVGRRARFLKVRILENYGAHFTTLSQVKILEGSASGYQSILASSDNQAALPLVTAVPVDETGIATEREPNNDVAEANRLEIGRRTKGSIDPLGERDHFRFSIPGTGAATLSVEVLGRPYIRTSVSLLDPAGSSLKSFDPGQLPADRAEFSWTVKPGDHIIRVTEPPASIVVIWDTSGSMGTKGANDLKQAVEAYLDQTRSSERLNLIRFSDNVEVLLPEFATDRAYLKASAAEKFFSRGSTKFYDAVAKGVELLDRVTGNRAIVVMTDGEDTGSKLRYPDFWRLLEEKRIRLYTIGLGASLQKLLPALGTSPARMMTHASMATNGRFFFARASDELKGVYQQIADELRAVSTYYLRATLGQGAGNVSVTAPAERLAQPGRIMLILDASGSMKRKLEGRTMMDIAKEAMTQIVKGLPEDAQVALRVYGHRIREGRPGDCKDTELLFPFGTIDKPRMLDKIRNIQALGTTPIEFTLRQIPRDLGKAPGENLVILITDGKEECKGDPAGAVGELVDKGLKFRLNVVGFALADAATRRDMDRIAQLTGGKFFDAKDAKSLVRAIEQSLTVPYDILDAAGDKVAGGVIDQGAVSVPEGIYTIAVQAAGQQVSVPNVRVTENRSTKIELRKEGREVGVKVSGPQ